MKFCLNCSTENPDDVMVCTECGVGLSKAPSGDDALRLREDMEEVAERERSLILTTGFAIEGRAITRHIGIVFAEIATHIGLKAAGEVDAGDLRIGKRSSHLEKKLEETRAACLEKLRQRALEAEADAVIGIEFDYWNMGPKQLVVAANGTAVKLSAPRLTTTLPGASGPPFSEGT